jgi:hypothetical protein
MGVPPALPGRQQKFDISGSRIHRPIVEALNREAPSTRKELHRWMMMEIKAHQVEVANSSYRSLPSCGGTVLGEAFTEWRDA